jgi:O-antigen/teichoic acid export membrane protein
MKSIYDKIMRDSLLKNSIFLMLSTGVMAVFGFFFWLICARLFSAHDVGLATAMISIVGLIVSFSLLGLNVGLIRYLPGSTRRDNKINTCFTLVTVVAIIVSSVFLIGLNKFSPDLLFIKKSLLFSLIFIFFIVISSWSSIIESIFISFRSSHFALIKNSIFSVLKVAFVFLFAGLGAYGIFSSYMIAMLVGFVTVFIILMVKFKYKPQFALYDNVIKRIGRYSFGNYIAGFIAGLPSMIFPLLILNKLGAEQSAYYYMAMMIASLLFVIPQATSNSLFAEGSYNEKQLKQQVKKSIKIISLLLIPAVVVIIFLGKYILLAFGKDYSLEGFRFLQLLALSSIFIGVNSVFGTLLKVKKKIKSLIVISILSAILVLGGSYLLIINGFGLLGIGYALLIGPAIISLIYLFFLRK